MPRLKVTLPLCSLMRRHMPESQSISIPQHLLSRNPKEANQPQQLQLTANKNTVTSPLQLTKSPDTETSLSPSWTSCSPQSNSAIGIRGPPGPLIRARRRLSDQESASEQCAFRRS